MMTATENSRFMFQPYGNETMKQSLISCNTRCNSDETVSLKGLAKLVLLRNSPCNTAETTTLQDETRDETERRTPFDREAFDERAAIIESNSIPREWAEGFAIICTIPRPSAYPSLLWQQIVDDAGYFLDQWGRQAAALGWRALDVFGVNPSAPESRYDGMGLIPLLNGRRVCAITTDTARIEKGGTFYRENMAADSVAIWALK